MLDALALCEQRPERPYAISTVLCYYPWRDLNGHLQTRMVSARLAQNETGLVGAFARASMALIAAPAG